MCAEKLKRTPLSVNANQCQIKYFVGCGVYCNQCAINGPGLCDPNQCQPGYMFDPASKTCQCMS